MGKKQKPSIRDFYESLEIHSMQLETIITLLEKAYDSDAILDPGRIAGLSMLLRTWFNGYMKILDGMDEKVNS